MSAVALNKPAPNFSFERNGTTASLGDFLGKKIVLYFYPKDNTPGCTQQACDFRDSFSRIEATGTAVLGVSPDSLRSHETFRTKHNLPFTLIPDENHSIATSYGVWAEKSMYGRTYMGIVRTTFLIDEKGVVIRIFPKVKVKGHVGEVLQAISAVETR